MAATADPVYSTPLTTRPVTTKTAAYSVLTSDYLILADAAGGVFTVTLPDAATVTGLTFVVKRTSASNTVTVKSVAGTLDGAAAATGVALDAQFKTRAFYSDGTNYQIVGAVG